MLGIDPTAARAAWTVFLFALVIAAAYAIREALVVFALALFFAYMLMPLVGFVERVTPRRLSRTFALGLVYLGFVAVLVFLAITTGSRIAEEASSLAGSLPDLVKNKQWVQTVPLPAWLEPVRSRIAGAVLREIDAGGRDILPFMKNIGESLVSQAGYLLYVIVVPILAFFFLKDGPRLRESVIDSFSDGGRRAMLDDILSDINRLLGQYIRAIILLAFSSFACYSVFLSATGAPYGMLLAVFAGLLDFIPAAGPLTAGALVLIVGGLSGYTHVLAFVVFWIVFRLFQDYVLAPYLMGSGVELDPLLVLFGVIAGERIAGVTGMFFSVPVIATLRVVFVRLQRARRRQLP